MALTAAGAMPSAHCGRVGGRCRDARDTLFLLGVIGWTVLPHLSHLPVWCNITATVLLWRARLALTQAPLPGRWVPRRGPLRAAGLTLWTHRTLLGKGRRDHARGADGIKTLELRARRDAFVVFFLFFLSFALPIRSRCRSRWRCWSQAC